MIGFSPWEQPPAVTITRADCGVDEPGFELARKGPLVKVEYLYTPFTGWVRAERVRQGRSSAGASSEADDQRLNAPAKKLADGYCRDCDKTVMVIGVEYSHDHPEHYDGVSEWRCPTLGCNRREGRWTGARLTDGASEPRLGEEHEQVIAEEQARKPEGSQPR